jgi:hypothetical protein
MRQESEGSPSKSKQHSCEAAVTELGPDNSPSPWSRILFLPFTTYFRTKDLLALKSCLRLVLAAILLITTLAWAITDLTPSSGPPFCILRPRRTVLSLTPSPSSFSPRTGPLKHPVHRLGDQKLHQSRRCVCTPSPFTSSAAADRRPQQRGRPSRQKRHENTKSNIQHPHNSQLLHICDVSAIGSPTIRTPALHSARQCVHFYPSSLF